MALAQTEHFARNTHSRLMEIPIGDIVPSPLNPRRRFDQEALEELAGSIREHGLIEPIVVREMNHTPSRSQLYSLIAGERRWRASQFAGLQVLPAVVRHEPDDGTAIRLMLIENLHRQDLDPIEEAEGYRALRDVGVKQSEIAAAINRSQPVVANALRLLDLPDEVRELVQSGQLSAAHGRALVKYAKWPTLCEKIAGEAIERGYPSKTLEKGVSHGGIQPYELKNAGVLADLPYDADVKALKAAGIEIWGEPPWAYTPDVAALKRETERIEKERNAERSRALQKIRDEGQKKPITLDKLKYDEYERLDHYVAQKAGIKPGDPGTCQAVDRDGSLVWITTDVQGMRKAKKAAEKAEHDAVRAAMDDYLWRGEEHIALTTVAGSREMALFAFYVLCRMDKPTRKAAWKRFATEDRMDPKIDDLSWNDWQADPRTLDWLAAWPASTLMRVALDAALRKSLSDRFTGYAMDAKLATWLTGVQVPAKGTEGLRPPSVPAPEQPAQGTEQAGVDNRQLTPADVEVISAQTEADPRCPMCGEPAVILEAGTEDATWACSSYDCPWIDGMGAEWEPAAAIAAEAVS